MSDEIQPSAPASSPAPALSPVKSWRSWLRGVAVIAGAVGLAAGAVELVSTVSCAAAPTNNPLRTFASARNVDVVCMKVLNVEDGGGVPPQPLPQAACTPVPTGVTGTILSNHLFALVTQVQRGEVAVVDLTGGYVVDEDLGTPGINLLPVGQIPTGIASSLDGQMSYVAAAEVDKPAIYALPSIQILGNSQGLEAGVNGPRSPLPPLLTTWPVCALPQTPGSITIIPNPPPEPAVDGGSTGTGDAGTTTETDAGAIGNPAGYVLAVVLPGTREGLPARLITVDPRPLLRGGGVAFDGGTEDSATDPPGALKPCTILGESLLSNQVIDAAPGPAWPTGVVWRDADVDAAVPSSASCTNQPMTRTDGAVAPSLPPPAPQPSAAARAGQLLYVADGALPLIHVFDISVPAHPREVEPLRATSLAQPTRAVTVSTLAISPPTRDYKRYLYAVDGTDSPASVIVFDITDPISSPHVPLQRPYSDLVPLQPQDRISFASGVSALAFVQHDWPLAQTPNGALVAGSASTGLLCNPNPNVDLFAADASADAQTFTDPGANYRYSSLAFADEPLGPSRLRGIFAFATLSNGTVVTIDVDDWDAPCRRPQYMGPSDGGAALPGPNGFTSAIGPFEPSVSGADGGALDPYEAPYTGITNGVTWVSNEVFFPVSEPHRPRSSYLLSDDPTLGIHFPYLTTVPELFAAGPDGGLGASATGAIAAGNPVLLPTATPFPDPSLLPDGGIGIRIGFEDPLAHIDQSWTVDYEGTLSSFSNILGTLAVTGEGAAGAYPAFYTLFVGDPGGAICSKGVEDWSIGQQRAAQLTAANSAQNLPALAPPEAPMSVWLGDYIQIIDQLLPTTDPYWSSDPNADQPNDCWSGFTGTGDAGVTVTDPTERYNLCDQIFNVDGNESISRDFPIIQAFDDGLVVTRFYYPNQTTTSTSNRVIAQPDSTNAYATKQLMCCFHGQATFNVRAGGEWLTTGSVSGYLHHMTKDPVTNRCVTSCDPQMSLLNSRAIGISPTINGGADGGIGYTPDRDSPLAMRNPTFAFYLEHPLDVDPYTATPGDTLYPIRPARDFVWQFALKGELSPLSINLAATNSNVSPQSMLFIPSLGQLAVVDGSPQGQGLILIDLNAVAVVGNTYY